MWRDLDRCFLLGKSLQRPKESVVPELQPEQQSPVLTNHRGSSCSPTPSMVASSHQVTLLLRLWDISSAAQILCTMRDLEHSVLFSRNLDAQRVACSTGRLPHAAHPSAGSVTHPSLPAHICRDT